MKIFRIGKLKSTPDEVFGTHTGRASITATNEQLVEGALTLDVNELLRRGVLARGSRTRGVISWHGPTGEVASVSYEADMTIAGEGRMRLRFSMFNMETAIAVRSTSG
jgi:hypothetical protein